MTNSGEVTEEEGKTGKTLNNRVVGGEMQPKIKEQGGGRGLQEKWVVGEKNGGRETPHLELGGEMGGVESEVTPMKDPPGETWKKEDLSEEDGGQEEEEMRVEASPTRTGGTPNPTQHRYQTAKWHQ